MRTVWLVLVCALLAAVLAAQAGATTLYSVPHNGSPLPGRASEGVVRFVGQQEMLVEADRGYGDEVRAAGRPCEVVAELTDEAIPVVCYPRSRNGSLEEIGEVVWNEPDGASLVLVSLDSFSLPHPACFMAYPLPQRVDTVAWFDERPVRGALPADRPERAVRGIVDDVLSAVSADTLMKHLENLCEYPGGDPRTRWIYRDECIDEAGAYIKGCLERYGVEVDTQSFTRLGYTCEQGDTGIILPYPMENIIGVLPGDGRLSGCYVIGGHYDATAVSSFPNDVMWWCENAAPGADDNGTGVATVLEAARVLAGSGATFPFDIRFALFTAEEVGLDGSRAYADSIAAAGDTVYAFLNVDMIGYKRDASHRDTCHIVTNTGTTWFADWIIDTTTGDYAAFFPSFDVERIDIALAYSDHASFWANGYDGLVAIEHYDPRDRNVNYHTVNDVMSTVFPSQFASTARMCVGALARLNDPDVAFNLVVDEHDFVFHPTVPSSGSPSVITIDAHAYGPNESVDMTLEVWDGEPDEGELLTSESYVRTMGGGEYVTHTFLWEPDEGDVGEKTLWVRVSTDGTDELTLTDNVASKTIHVTAPELYVTRHFVWPNPAPGAGDVQFRYELSREAAAMDLEVFDLTGQSLGKLEHTLDEGAGDAANQGLLSGWNDLAWDRLEDGVDELASGVYVYRLRVWDRGASEEADMVTGRLAIVR